MKQLTCEMCGSTDLVKDGGVFVCQSCGCKYSVEEAKKMMIEGTVEVTGTVRVDNSASINNYINLANNALDSSNYKEAEGYANKIIEIEPINSTAWFIKGKAAAWQSTGADNKISEALSAWLKALECVKEENVQDLRDNIVIAFAELFKAMVNLYGGNYAQIHNEDALKTLILTIENGLEVMRQLTVKGCSFNWMAFNNSLAEDLNGFAVKAYKDAKNDVAIYHDFAEYKKACAGAVRVLCFAGHYATTDSLLKTIASNLEVINKIALDKLCIHSIDNYRKYADINKEDIITYVVGDSTKAEEEAAIKQYWEEHADEKKELKAKRNRYSQELDAINSELVNNSDIRKYAEKEKELIDAQTELSQLGLFKGKEKKALQDRISEITKSLEMLKETKEVVESELSGKKKQISANIEEIDNEFNKSRGRVPVKNNYFVGNGIKEGKINITINQLVEVIKSVLPKELKFKGVSEGANYCYFEEMAKSSYAIEIIEANDPKSQGCGVLFRCFADSLDSPIKAISFSTPQMIEQSTKYLVLFATATIMAFDESATIDSVARVLTSFFKGSLSTSRIVEDNYSYELFFVQSNLMNIMDIVQKGILIRNK